jgi:hypothetical protein
MQARDYHVPSHSIINSWIHGLFRKLRQRGPRMLQRSSGRAMVRF